MDGGASANSLMLQLQADLLQVPVLRPAYMETTAIGAAFAAGASPGFGRSDCFVAVDNQSWLPNAGSLDVPSILAALAVQRASVHAHPAVASFRRRAEVSDP